MENTNTGQPGIETGMDADTLDKLEALAKAARDDIIRSHGWAGTVDGFDALRTDEQYLLAANPATIITLIALARSAITQQAEATQAPAVASAIASMDLGEEEPDEDPPGIFTKDEVLDMLERDLITESGADSLRNGDSLKFPLDELAILANHAADRALKAAASLASTQGAAQAPVVREVPEWRVGEFWSSARPGEKVLMLATGIDIENFGRHKDFIRWLAASPATVTAPAQPVELAGVAEEIAEGSGFWRECSGCYDTEDGRPTQDYAYSHVFGCALGSGCSECGGIGAVWDNTDYEAMARDWDEDAAPAAQQAAPTVCLACSGDNCPTCKTNRAAPTTAGMVEDAKDAAEEWIRVGQYFVSNTGKVSDGEKLLQAYLRNEYLAVSTWEHGERIERPVHRMVAEAFCKRMDEAQTQVNHRDGDKLNNLATNLEWCSPAENRIHATRISYIGTRPVIGKSLSDGKEIRFNSLAEASEAGFKHANIQKVIAGERKQHGGYMWRDADETLAAQQAQASAKIGEKATPETKKENE